MCRWSWLDAEDLQLMMMMRPDRNQHPDDALGSQHPHVRLIEWLRKVGWEAGGPPQQVHTSRKKRN